MKKHIITIGLLLLGLSHAIGQKAVGNFMRLRIDDATKFAKAYLNPYGEMLGVNLNSGWYTAASVHKLLGFDLTFEASLTQVPSADKTFDISKLDLSQWEPADASKTMTPTMAGKISDIPSVHNKLGVIPDVPLPNGSGASYMASPMIQASVGLPYHTEIIARYMPTVSYKQLGDMGLWGVGIKHSIKEYIPGIKRLPILKLTVLGAYTKFNGGIDIPDNAALSNGRLDITSDAFTTRLLVGANLPMVAFYTGVGYGHAKSQFDINGTYTDPFTSSTQDGTIIGLNFNNSGVDFNAGMRIRLGVIGIHGDYSVGKYSVITAGVGINFR